MTRLSPVHHGASVMNPHAPIPIIRVSGLLIGHTELDGEPKRTCGDHGMNILNTLESPSGFRHANYLNDPVTLVWRAHTRSTAIACAASAGLPDPPGIERPYSDLQPSTIR